MTPKTRYVVAENRSSLRRREESRRTSAGTCLVIAGAIIFAAGVLGFQYHRYDRLGLQTLIESVQEER